MADSLISSSIVPIRHFKNSLTNLADAISPLSTGAATRLACVRACVRVATSPSIKGFITLGSRSLAPSNGKASDPLFLPSPVLPAHSLKRTSRASSALSIHDDKFAFARSNSCFNSSTSGFSSYNCTSFSIFLNLLV